MCGTRIGTATKIFEKNTTTRAQPEGNWQWTTNSSLAYLEPVQNYLCFLSGTGPRTGFQVPILCETGTRSGTVLIYC